ncbi:MAG: hypothetical protein QT08_C0022G0007 [archaeon GW2011_AR17]|nr:MAG: hypothetical protein QT08_C0022G0007 [archaeon GW2011_AR17]MBS3154570.1 hypothetical protein [Candidatus Woesearchaeota archaeon]HIH15528.1 hypothetical protein [Nanoarchaeota archaeon]HIH59503.1 hypothetical protein [Nanoarchaeota archaeon]HIJ05185.1 hypothetical protein [Nanoarchaeota archaeon]
MVYDDTNGIYNELVRNIFDRTFDSSLEVQTERSLLEKKLETVILERLKFCIPAWKRNGSMAELSVICTLPANHMIKENAETYERIIYGAAKKILINQGFFLKEGRWHYRK